MCRNSLPGVEWTDVIAAMKAEDALFGGQTTLIFEQDGSRFGSGMRVSIVCQLPRLQGAAEAPPVAIGADWPHPDHRTMESLCLALVYKMDWRLTNERQVQSSFIK